MKPTNMRILSKAGCWTCRLRHKKCDERKPVCQVCESLGITCHFEEQKPEWMDGGEREKGSLVEIKLAIRKTTSRRAVLRNTRKVNENASREDTIANNDDEHSNSFGPLIITSGSLNNAPTSTLSSSAILRGQRTEEDSGNQVHISTPPRTESNTSSANPNIRFEASSISDDTNGCYISTRIDDRDRDCQVLLTLQGPAIFGDFQESLLMGYLDYVFPLQFPFYSPSPLGGGRAWILSTLIRSKALYHPALSLSAYYQAIILSPNPKHAPCVDACWVQLQKHHLLSLQELQSSMNKCTNLSQPKSLVVAVRALGAIVQLLYFEVFSGITQDWPIHLNAACAVFKQVLSQVNHDYEQLLSILRSELIPDNLFKMWGAIMPCIVDEASFRFFTCVLLWIDTMSAISLKSKPKLQSYHQTLLANDSTTILIDDLMGCQNWTVTAIGEIAALDAWKYEMKEIGKLSMVELVDRSRCIEEAVQRNLGELGMAIPTSTRASGVRPHQPTNTQHISSITRLFANAALIYLHVVVSGPHPDLPEIQKCVIDNMSLLSPPPTLDRLRALVWPLCITACMALPGQESFFRDILKSVGETGNKFGNLDAALKCMERCWEQRGSMDREGWEWSELLKKSSQGIVLLV